MEREKLNERARRIREHPRFAHASSLAIRNYLAWRMSLGVLNKLISNLARERILEQVLFLHFSRDAQGGHGATFERLAAASEARDRIGSRAVRTALRLAQIAGHMAISRSFEDGRLRIYQPTESLLKHASDYYAIFLDALEALDPELGAPASLREQPGYLEGLIGRVGRAYLAGERSVGEKLDAFDSLLRLEGARPILATAVDCHLHALELPPAPELARRYHISASQARAVLKNTQARGLLRLAGRGRLDHAEPLSQAYLAALTRSLAFISLYAT